MTKLFDINRLDDEYKIFCEGLLSRVETISRNLAQAYPGPEADKPVIFRYSCDPSFNSIAKTSSSRHEVEISISCVFLLHSLYSRLFGFRCVIPELPINQETAVEGELPFRARINAMGFKPETIKLDDHRYFLSSIMLEFACTFILMHELSHIICGHTTAARSYFKDSDEYPEFFSIPDLIFRKNYLRQSWERDADICAAGLFSQSIAELFKGSESETLRSALAFAKGNPAKAVGLIMASVFSMFVYMAEMKFKTESASFHPKPMILIAYMGEILVPMVADALGLNPDGVGR